MPESGRSSPRHRFSTWGHPLCERSVPRVWDRGLPRLSKKKINHFIYLFRRESLRRRPSHIAMSNSTPQKFWVFGRKTACSSGYQVSYRTYYGTKVVRWPAVEIPLLSLPRRFYPSSSRTAHCCRNLFVSMPPKPSEVLNVIEVPTDPNLYR